MYNPKTTFDEFNALGPRDVIAWLSELDKNARPVLSPSRPYCSTCIVAEFLNHHFQLSSCEVCYTTVCLFFGGPKHIAYTWELPQGLKNLQTWFDEWHCSQYRTLGGPVPRPTAAKLLAIIPRRFFV